MPSTTPLSLLEELKASDDVTRDPAWARFVFLYTPMLMQWASRQGFQESECEDLVQETFVRLINSLPGYQKQATGSFRGWLMTVLRNLGRDYRRRKATRNLGTEDPAEDHAVENPWVDIEESEFRQWVIHRGLQLVRDDFSSETWQAFKGLVMEGKSAQVVSQELGVSVNSVYLARHRVLAKLRLELADFIDDL